jgi:hypothetical protein
MKKMSPRPRVVRGTKTSVEIRPELYRAAKLRALDEPGGLRGVIERALDAYLGERKTAAKKRP